MTYSPNNQGGFGGGGFSQPGGRTIRQENKQTELELPAMQAGLRAIADVIAVILVLVALTLLGRWVIWGLVSLFFFSEMWDKFLDNLIGKFYGAGAGTLEIGAVIVKWGWIIVGYLVLKLIFPFTWTMEALWIQFSTIEPAWPFVWGVATMAPLPFRPLARIVWLIICIVPLASLRPLRDRMLWALWEFTPYGPVDIATLGIDPHKWGAEKASPQSAQNNEMGVIFERTDFEPHVERLAEGVYISNGTGRSSLRIDMRWVTEEQWETVARMVVVEQQPFDESTLGRGRVFPTHGAFSTTYNANLGYRFFRDQMIEAGRVERVSNHPNAGVTLTPAGEDFLRRRFLDGNEGDDDA